MHAKLVRRHPHVFGDAEADSAGRVRERWEAIKTEQEGPLRRLPRRAGGAPGPAPRAQGATPRGHGRDSTGPASTGPLAKMREELAEIEVELARAGRPAPETEADPRVFAELGDLLFTVVNVARVVNVDPELALRATSRRFVERVELAERLAAEAGETWAELDLDAQEAWYVAREGAARRRPRPARGRIGARTGASGSARPR